MNGIWVTLCILSAVVLAYLMGRQTKEDQNIDEGGFESMRGLRPPTRMPPPMPQIKKPRIRVCGSCVTSNSFDC